MTARPQPLLRILCVLVAVVLATAFASDKLGSPATGIDDANIFFVYARNLSAGEGFVFNPGGERVEGFTSLLWVIFCSAAIVLSKDPEVLLLVVNIGLVCVTILWCLRSTVLEYEGMAGSPFNIWGVTFTFLLLLDFRYVVWNTIALMENALWGTLLAMTTLLTIAKEARGSAYNAAFAALIALMLATRPEALAWGPAFLVLWFLKHASTDGSRQASRAVIPGGVLFIVTAVLLTIFRISYFGMPLPNTYYAKVSPSLTFRLSEGAGYLWRYLSSGPVPFACALAVVLPAVQLVIRKERDQRALALTVLGLVALTVPVLTGGDHFDGFRFYQSVYPILLLALLNWMRFSVRGYVVRGRVRHTAGLIAATISLAVVTIFGVADRMQYNVSWLRHEFDLAATGRQRGADAAAIFDGIRPMPNVATIAVGGFKYGYSGDVVDLMGLNNTIVARNGGNRIGLRSHAAFETHTLYELEPTVIAPLVEYTANLRSAAQRRAFVDMVLKGVLQEERFLARYRLAEVRKDTPQGPIAFAAWYDREFLRNLSRQQSTASLQVVLLDRAEE